MERCADIDAFVAAPVGRFVDGRTFCYWFARLDLAGFFVWGRPDAADVDRLCRAFDCALHEGGQPFTSVADLSAVESVTPAAFARCAEHFASHGRKYVGRIQRQVVLHPGGFTGSLVAGFFNLFEPPGALLVSSRAGGRAALAGLGLSPDVVSEVEALGATYAQPAIVRRLRALLASDPTQPLARIARGLHVSERSLQRHLSAAGTHLERERAYVRIERAKEHLAMSDVPVTDLALDLGFSSSQHLAKSFRRITGDTPSAFRARVRSAP